MARNVAIGIQDFGELIQKKCFYIGFYHGFAFMGKEVLIG